jgi:hypothetical protein
MKPLSAQGTLGFHKDVFHSVLCEAIVFLVVKAKQRVHNNRRNTPDGKFAS